MLTKQKNCYNILLYRNSVLDTENLKGGVEKLLGSRIKEYLDDNGIKYTHVSEKTGIPMNALSPLLNEKRDVKATEYFVICHALNVPLTKFSD